MSGCYTSSVFEFSTWKDENHLYKVSKNLKIGDVIITSKNWKNPMSWFGHSAVMVSRYKVGEYPKLCHGYYETDVISWISKKKEFTVLRYKAFNEKFKTAFLKNLPDTKHKQYRIVEKTYGRAFYCSQYIWYLYWKTAKDLGYDLDIDNEMVILLRHMIY